jgi:hypothetical protein
MSDSAEHKNWLGLVAMCVLDPGYAGPHVATGGRAVVEVRD